MYFALGIKPNCNCVLELVQPSSETHGYTHNCRSFRRCGGLAACIESEAKVTCGQTKYNVSDKHTPFNYIFVKQMHHHGARWDGQSDPVHQ